MTDKYPLPDYALTVWVAGDNLMVAFPGCGTERGHTIKLPASAAGLQTAITILKDREHAKDRRIGNHSAPTQWNLESDKRYKAWLKAMSDGKAKEEAALAEAEELLEELGL